MLADIYIITLRSSDSAAEGITPITPITGPWLAAGPTSTPAETGIPKDYC